jgi:hypothetical protein
MADPTSEVGYTSATTGRGDHEVHEGHVAAWGERFSLNILPETFLLRRTQRDAVINSIGLLVQYPLLLLDFNEA